jgi:hypothetical protein
LESVLRHIGVAAAEAARAMASSPSGWARRWYAVGAIPTGIAIRRPSRVVERSRVPTSTSTRGRSGSRSNAARFSRRVTSSFAPLAK